ncbi:MAG: TIGR04283 family arsenosugar biosynthesis glycosyltransferase [Planctomycetota bacterium]|nr:TIGR04283 family arsenosugar biosynthesis glycosyltransferase [Planctomycetota bacterium]
MTSAAAERLIAFARWPEPGRAKTRLIPALGPSGAAALQRRMTQLVLATVDRAATARGFDVEVCFEGGDAERMGALFGPERMYHPQSEGDLGLRLARAFDISLAAGASRVVIIGTDCPALDASVLVRAFEQLERHDVVLGPAEDGGYYLVGLRAPAPALFADIPWSSPAVLRLTLVAAAEHGLTVARLPTRRDVDRPADVEHADVVLASSLAVIVPTLNEGPRLRATLEAIRGASAVELIVVDGGSRDDTCAVAEAYGARVVHSAPGRAQQMNAGADAAYSGTLLFCHADTHLPPGYEEHVQATLARPRTALGAFDLALRGPEPGLRRIERAVRRRSRRWLGPYGDQCLFLRRSVFNALRGLRALPILEDLDLVQRARRLGRIEIAAASASSSARYWRRHGFIRGTLRNQAVLLGWYLGIAPATLARWRAGRQAAQPAGEPEADSVC